MPSKRLAKSIKPLEVRGLSDQDLLGYVNFLLRHYKLRKQALRRPRGLPREDMIRKVREVERQVNEQIKGSP